MGSKLCSQLILAIYLMTTTYSYPMAMFQELASPAASQDNSYLPISHDPPSSIPKDLPSTFTLQDSSPSTPQDLSSSTSQDLSSPLTTEPQPTTEAIESQPTTEAVESQPSTLAIEQQLTTEAIEQQPSSETIKQLPTTEPIEQPITENIKQHPDVTASSVDAEAIEQQPTTEDIEQQPEVTASSVDAEIIRQQQSSETLYVPFDIRPDSPVLSVLTRDRPAKVEQGNFKRILKFAFNLTLDLLLPYML